MLSFLLFLLQFVLIGLYDWIFFINDYIAFSSNCWWAFAFLHATFLTEFVSVILLRRMKLMPITKKHPIWLFTIITGIQLVMAVVFSLVGIIKLKWVIILSASIYASELLSLGVLLLVQKNREKKENDDVALTEIYEEPREEEKRPLPPKKIKSSAILILMKFLADPADWDVPEGFDEINALNELASSSTQYTYATLSSIESDLKEQTDALKMYIHNKSMERAKKSVFTIMDLLEEREKRISDVENNWE